MSEEILQSPPSQEVSADSAASLQYAGENETTTAQPGIDLYTTNGNHSLKTPEDNHLQVRKAAEQQHDEQAQGDPELVYWESVTGKSPISKEYLEFVHVEPNILKDEGATLDESGKLIEITPQSLARLEAREKVFVDEARGELELAHAYDDDKKLTQLHAEVMKIVSQEDGLDETLAKHSEDLKELLQNRISTMDDIRQCWHNFHSNIAKRKLGVAHTIGGFLNDVRTGHASKSYFKTAESEPHG